MKVSFLFQNITCNLILSLFFSKHNSDKTWIKTLDCGKSIDFMSLKTISAFHEESILNFKKMFEIPFLQRTKHKLAKESSKMKLKINLMQ